MIKEFLPYELALKIKELGFDEPCFGIWKDGKLISVGGHWGAGITHSMFGFEGDRFAPDECRAPTYSQAFRWFREKYGLYSAVNVDQTMEPKFVYCISKYWTDALSWGWDTIVFNSDLYYSYEEAELACLTKLIEIIEELKKSEQ
jgi:hypothetical protein